MGISYNHQYAQRELNVDVFFAFLGKSDPKFKIASLEQSSKFSFELCPEELFKYNKGKLLFGCHAWPKHSPDFWMPIMNSFGLELEDQSIKKRRLRRTPCPVISLLEIHENVCTLANTNSQKL